MFRKQQYSRLQEQLFPLLRRKRPSPLCMNRLALPYLVHHPQPELLSLRRFRHRPKAHLLLPQALHCPQLHHHRSPHRFHRRELRSPNLRHPSHHRALRPPAPKRPQAHQPQGPQPQGPEFLEPLLPALPRSRLPQPAQEPPRPHTRVEPRTAP